MSLIPIDPQTKLSDLHVLGELKELGPEILEGNHVLAYGLPTHGVFTDAINAGYFGTSKGRYRIVYPFSEQATLLQGEVRITDESTGTSTVFKPGDSWFVEKGTSTLWEVLSEGYVKHYLAFS